MENGKICFYRVQSGFQKKISAKAEIFQPKFFRDCYPQTGKILGKITTKSLHPWFKIFFFIESKGNIGKFLLKPGQVFRFTGKKLNCASCLQIKSKLPDHLEIQVYITVAGIFCILQDSSIVVLEVSEKIDINKLFFRF